MTLVEPPRVMDRYPHLVHLVHGYPKGPYRALKNRGERDIKYKTLFFENLTRIFGLGDPLFGKVDIGPAGEPVLFVPDTLSVAEQN
jgi:hypothetical protein